MNADDLVRSLNDLQFGHLEHRNCTAESPMPEADKDKYRWHHPEAKEGMPFFNLVVCTCPHCGLSFSCLPRRT